MCVWGGGVSYSKGLCNALLYPEVASMFSEPQLAQSLEAALRVVEWGGTSDKGPSFIGVILWRALRPRMWPSHENQLGAAWRQPCGCHPLSPGFSQPLAHSGGEYTDLQDNGGFQLESPRQPLCSGPAGEHSHSGSHGISTTPAPALVQTTTVASMLWEQELNRGSVF